MRGNRVSKDRGSLDIDWGRVDSLIRTALREDVGKGDFTTKWIVAPDENGTASLVFKESAVVAGIDIAVRVWQILDKNIKVKRINNDGERVRAGTAAARISGSLRSLLAGERTALNFLQRLSGIATVTAEFVGLVKGTKAKILDTRKTVPGFRYLDKYAVKTGGGSNHRFGLFDMILIKENHQRLPGGITEAFDRVRKKNKMGLPVEIEVGNLPELREALGLPVDRIMLDNMSLENIVRAVEMAGTLKRGRKQPLIEASGNITLQNVREVARTGVDLISVGALTHSVRAADVSLILDF